MRLITTSDDLENTFRQLLDDYRHISFAVAWASAGFPRYKQLLTQRHKIIRGIVGLHFNQTHPEFITQFMNDARVVFVMRSDGVFHPKVYLFENSNNDWACLLGSANFTKSAFKSNNESCVVFSSEIDQDGTLRKGLDAAFKAYGEQGAGLNTEQLARYQSLWKDSQSKRNVLGGTFADEKARPVLETPLLLMSWDDFLKGVLSDKWHDFKLRTQVLETSRRLFNQYERFSDMPDGQRQGVAGVGREGDVQWGYFGSMSGAGTFRSRVNRNDPSLSLALDAIPRGGSVTREDYMRFINQYLKAFPGGRGHGLGTATRLLAMKRPDYFVCFDRANKRGLCEAFGINPLREHDYDRYWDSIIERIMISPWWRSERPSTAGEAIVWDARTAFLDSLYYEEFPSKR